MEIKNYKNKIFSVTNLGIKNTVVLVFLLILLSITEVLSIALVYPFIDFVINQQDAFIQEYNLSYIFETNQDSFTITLILGTVLILSFLVKLICSIFLRWKISSFIWYNQSKLQVNLLKAYQLIDYEYFTFRGKSDLVNNLKELTRAVIQSLEGWLKLISETVIYIFILAYLISINYKSVIILSILVGIIFLFYHFLFRSKIIKLGRENLEGEKTFFSAVDENIKGFKEVKIFKKENFFLEKVKQGTEIIANSNIKTEILSLFPRLILELSAVCLLIFLILISIKSENNPSDLLPVLGVFSLAAVRIIPGVNLILLSLYRINYGSYALEKLYDDLKRANKLKIVNTYSKSNDTSSTNKDFKNLKVENLSFRYKRGQENIFEALNFEIKSKECVGIIGDSGIGKTTLVDLILGLLKPNSGKIYINGNELKNYESLYSIASYLPQDPVVLDSSIEKNISFQKETSLINKKRIEESLKFAELYNFVSSLPNKTNTLIGESGINLSGGQKQRLLLARNFYFDREIIILDEATSALDLETQKNITRNIELLKNNKTLIIITHKIETLKNCHKVFKIENKKLKIYDQYK